MIVFFTFSGSDIAGFLLSVQYLLKRKKKGYKYIFLTSSKKSEEHLLSPSLLRTLFQSWFKTSCFNLRPKWTLSAHFDCTIVDAATGPLNFPTAWTVRTEQIAIGLLVYCSCELFFPNNTKDCKTLFFRLNSVTVPVRLSIINSVLQVLVLSVLRVITGLVVPEVSEIYSSTSNFSCKSEFRNPSRTISARKLLAV